MEVLATLFPHDFDTTIPVIIMDICLLVAWRARNRVLCITACVCLFFSSLLVAGEYNGLLMSLLCAAAITAPFLITRMSEDEPPETLLERAFRKAVSKSKEDLSIKLGKKLLQKGDQISVERALTGFEHLISEGSGRSMEPYASAVCQYSQLYRRMIEEKGDSSILGSVLVSHLNGAVRLYKTCGSTADAAMLQRLKAEQLYSYVIYAGPQNAGFLTEERMKEYRENAAKILDELAADAADDPYVRDAIAYAKEKGIKPLPVSKPSAPDNPPKKPDAPSEPPGKPAVTQTLKTCLRCGAALSGKKCGACGLDHTKAPVYLLVKADSRDLQIST